MLISYDYYRIFYFVAKYGNFTQAANVLMSNQPNLTRAVKNLEAELGCTLFVRSNRGVTLTPEGSKLYKSVSIACEQLQAGENELSQDLQLQRGIVSIGTTETALHGFLLPALRQYRIDYPEVRIRISNYSNPQAIHALQTGLVDFAVITTPTGASKPLKEKRLHAFREILTAGPRFKELCGHTLHLSDLQKYPLICTSHDTRTYEFYSRFFSDNGVMLSPDLEVATTDHILPLVKENLGIGFLPETFAKGAIENGEILEVKLSVKIPQRYICLVKRADRPTGIAAGVLEKLLLERSSL